MVAIGGFCILGCQQFDRCCWEDEDRQNPDKIFNIQRVLKDGDFVAVHSHLQRNPGDPGIAVVHIFRFDNDIIVEFWDVAQFIPQDMVNENGMF